MNYDEMKLPESENIQEKKIPEKYNKVKLEAARNEVGRNKEYESKGKDPDTEKRC